MVNLEHIKTLGPVELKIVLYLNLTEKTLSISQENLAKEISCSVRSVREALKSLEARGIISYTRSFLTSEKSKIIYQ